jgi:predicted alpha/beta-fold hydrolase
MPAFRPHPLFRGGHAQTIAGSYLPWKAATNGACASPIRREVLLEDGDRLVLHDDRPASWCAGGPVALLLHGLCGSHRSCYMARVSHKLAARGVRVFRQDLRGFGAGFNTARGHCHAGKTEDVLATLQWTVAECQGSPVTLIGFSLGANMVLKLLGELGGAAPAGLARAVAAAPPIDLLHCSRNLQLGLNRLYDWSFVSQLNGLLGERRRAVKDLIDVELSQKPRRLWAFDDRYTAIVAGYRSAEEYYAKASSGPYLEAIRIPTLLVTAADDPVVPVAMFDRWPVSSTVNLCVTNHGGHLGYIGVSGVDPDRRWLDWRIVDWTVGGG